MNRSRAARVFLATLALVAMVAGAGAGRAAGRALSRAVGDAAEVVPAFEPGERLTAQTDTGDPRKK
jgi:hypothetical protein